MVWATWHRLTQGNGDLLGQKCWPLREAIGLQHGAPPWVMWWRCPLLPGEDRHSTRALPHCMRPGRQPEAENSQKHQHRALLPRGLQSHWPPGNTRASVPGNTGWLHVTLVLWPEPGPSPLQVSQGSSTVTCDNATVNTSHTHDDPGRGTSHGKTYMRKPNEFPQSLFRSHRTEAGREPHTWFDRLSGGRWAKGLELCPSG